MKYSLYWKMNGQNDWAIAASSDDLGHIQGMAEGMQFFAKCDVQLRNRKGEVIATRKHDDKRWEGQ